MHIYLLRGLFNVFSLGMDELRDKLGQRGFQASVHNHLAWSALADEAVSDYRKGRLRLIVIMGHSQGAINAVDMANRIGNAGVPVSLVFTFDPAFRTKITSNNVRWVVNLYVSDGIGAKVEKAPAGRTIIENIDLRGIPVGHMNVDKSKLIQQWAINYSFKVARNHGRPAPGHDPAAAMRARAGVSDRMQAR